MNSFDRIELQRIVTAAVGALVLSTACIMSAVGPARAAETAPAAATAQPTAGPTLG